MAQAFNLTAQMQLQAPTGANVNQVMNQITSALNDIGINVRINANPRDLANINSQIQNSTRSVNDLNKSLRISAQRFGVITLATGTLLSLVSSFKQSIKEAIAFERELVRIAQTTGSTVSELSSLANEVTRLSVNLGASSTELLSTARILAQAGFSAEQTRKSLDILAKTTLGASFDDITETTEGAIAVLRQFSDEAARTGGEIQFLEQTLDAINSVSKAFAVESSDLIAVIRRTGGVFAAAGGSVNELISLFTSVRATTRESAETIATGLRTIFTRIQRTETIDQLKTLGINLRDAEGNFVGAFEAVKRLSEGLSTIDPRSGTFSSIVEELGGFRQVGKVIPLIQQFRTAQEALNVAQNSSGSVAKDAETAQQALGVQIQKLREQFDALVRKFTASDTFEDIATSAIKFAEAILRIADALEPLLPLLATFAALKLGKVLGGFTRDFLSGASNSGRTNQISRFATGGIVPGSGNRDTVPAMLTPGEFVIRKSSVNKIGADTLAQMNANGYDVGGKVNIDAIRNRIADERGSVAYKGNKPLSNKGIGVIEGLSDQLNLLDDGRSVYGGAFLSPQGITSGVNGSVNKKQILDKLKSTKAYTILAGAKKGSIVYEEVQEIIKAAERQSDFTVSTASLSKQTSQDVENSILSGVLEAVTEGTKFLNKATGSDRISSGGDTEATKILRSTNIDNVIGNIFEAILINSGSPYSNSDKDLANDPFDFPFGLGEAVASNFSKKLSEIPTDAKTRFTSDNIKTFINKARNYEAATLEANLESILNRPEVIDAILNTDTIIKKGTGLADARTELTKRQKGSEFRDTPLFKASGGSIAGSDTVPAMLTPGEFVINKSAAQSIGYGNLNRMNKYGVTGYAKGGPVAVQYFSEAGPVRPSDALDVQMPAGEIPPNQVEAVVEQVTAALDSLGYSVEEVTEIVASNAVSIQENSEAQDDSTDSINEEARARANSISRLEKFQNGLSKIQGVAESAQKFVFLGSTVTSLISEFSSLDEETKKATERTAAWVAGVVGVAGTVIDVFASLASAVAQNVAALRQSAAAELSAEASTQQALSSQRSSAASAEQAIASQNSARASTAQAASSEASARASAQQAISSTTSGAGGAAGTAAGAVGPAATAGTGAASAGGLAALFNPVTLALAALAVIVIAVVVAFKFFIEKYKAATETLINTTRELQQTLAETGKGAQQVADNQIKIAQRVETINTMGSGRFTGASVEQQQNIQFSRGLARTLAMAQGPGGLMTNAFTTYMEGGSTSDIFKSLTSPLEGIGLISESRDTSKFEENVRVLEELNKGITSTIEAFAELTQKSVQTKESLETLRSRTGLTEEQRRAEEFKIVAKDGVIDQNKATQTALEAGQNALNLQEVQDAFESGEIADFNQALKIASEDITKAPVGTAAALTALNNSVNLLKTAQKTAADEINNNRKLLGEFLGDISSEDAENIIKGNAPEEIGILIKNIETNIREQARAQKRILALESQAASTTEERKEEIKKEVEEIENSTNERIAAERQYIKDVSQNLIDRIAAEKDAIKAQKNYAEEIKKLVGVQAAYTQQLNAFTDYQNQIGRTEAGRTGAVVGAEAAAIKETDLTNILDPGRFFQDIDNIIAQTEARTGPTAQTKSLQEGRERILQAQTGIESARSKIVGRETLTTDEAKDILIEELGLNRDADANLLKIISDKLAESASKEGLIGFDDFNSAIAEYSKTLEQDIANQDAASKANQAYLNAYQSYLNEVNRLWEQEVDGRAKALQTFQATLSNEEKARGLLARSRGTEVGPSDFAQRAAQRETKLAQENLTGAKTGITAGNLGQLEQERVRLLSDIDTQTSQGVSTSEEQKELNENQRRLAAVNRELERIENSGNAANAIFEQMENNIAVIERERRAREQVTGVVEEFVIGGEEARQNLLAASQGIQQAYATGTLQMQTPEQRQATVGLLDKLSDVKLSEDFVSAIPGQEGKIIEGTGKNIKQELIFRDAIRMGLDPKIAKELATATSVEEKLIQENQKLVQEINTLNKNMEEARRILNIPPKLAIKPPDPNPQQIPPPQPPAQQAQQAQQAQKANQERENAERMDLTDSPSAEDYEFPYTQPNLEGDNNGPLETLERLREISRNAAQNETPSQPQAEDINLQEQIELAAIQNQEFEYEHSNTYRDNKKRGEAFKNEEVAEYYKKQREEVFARARARREKEQFQTTSTQTPSVLASAQQMGLDSDVARNLQDEEIKKRQQEVLERSKGERKQLKLEGAVYGGFDQILGGNIFGGLKSMMTPTFETMKEDATNGFRSLRDAIMPSPPPEQLPPPPQGRVHHLNDPYRPPFNSDQQSSMNSSSVTDTSSKNIFDNFGSVFDNITKVFSGVSNSLNKLAESFGGFTMQHTVTVEGLINLGGLNIDTIKNELSKSIGQMVSEEVTKILDNRSNNFQAGG